MKEGTERAFFLFLGILFAWFALVIMLTNLYEGLVEVQVSVVQGGNYRPYFMLGDDRFFWGIAAFLSSICVAISARPKKKEAKEEEVVKKLDDIAERLEEISEKLSKRSGEEK